MSSAFSFPFCISSDRNRRAQATHLLITKIFEQTLQSDAGIYMHMTSVFCTKASCHIDEEWGQSVVDLVNSRLGLSINYVPPSSPRSLREGKYSETPKPLRNKQSQERASHYRYVTILPVDTDDTDASRQQRFLEANRAYAWPEYPSMENKSRRHHNEFKRRSGLRSYSSASPVYSSRAYPDEHSFRLPDFVKRVFAPPNCLTPATSSMDDSVSPCSSRPHSDITGSNRQLLTKAVFGNLSPDRFPLRVSPRSTTTPKMRIRKSKSSNVRDQASIPRSNAKPWQDTFEHKQRLNWSVSIDGQSTPLRLSRESQALRPDFSSSMQVRPGKSHLGSTDSTAHQSRSVLSQSRYSTVPAPDFRASNSCFQSLGDLLDDPHSASTLRQLQMEADVEKFLNSAPKPRPLTASEINQICEQAENIDTLPEILTSLLASTSFRPLMTSSSSDVQKD